MLEMASAHKSAIWQPGRPVSFAALRNSASRSDGGTWCSTPLRCTSCAGGSAPGSPAVKDSRADAHLAEARSMLAPDGSKPREVLVDLIQLDQLVPEE